MEAVWKFSAGKIPVNLSSLLLSCQSPEKRGGVLGTLFGHGMENIAQFGISQDSRYEHNMVMV